MSKTREVLIGRFVDINDEIPLEGWRNYMCGHCSRFPDLLKDEWSNTRICCGPDRFPIFRVTRLSKACPVADIFYFEMCDCCMKIFYREHIRTTIVEHSDGRTETRLCHTCTERALNGGQEDAGK